jgi:3',5'-cyclic AMP phosphodiesterase CpdA
MANDAKTDPNRFALLADTHIAGDREQVVRGVNMCQHFQRVAKELLALDPQPAATLIDGDCALLVGTSEDYKTLLELVEPLRKGGLPVHLALGNHDHRERFWQAAGQDVRQSTEVADRHVLVIPAPHANWILLDSLDVTNKTPGVLGQAQLAWLGEALDQAADKPAVIVVHHNLDEREKTSGLTDTTALLEVLKPRRHVKAVVFGHTHYWNVREQEGLHLINLPPVAYVFAKGRPSGWVDAHLASGGIRLQLRCIDRTHSQHDQVVELSWRS